MASAHNPSTIRRCEPAGAGRALALVAQSWPEVERETQLNSLRAAMAAGRADAAIVLAAEKQGQLVGAVLAQVLPGKVAAVIPPRFEAAACADLVEISRQLLGQLNAELNAAGVELAQSLVAPDDAAGRAAMQAGGYEHAADLLYMAAEKDSFPEHPLPLPLEVIACDPADEARLVRLVDATYAGTLDCPRIDGLRATRDVLAGYRAVGQSGDSLWHLVTAAGRDAGCLLLAAHRQTRQWEIVYVGLIPEVRGRGWGLELARHAQYLTRQAGSERLVLAVDAANDPAICMYATAGFRVWDRRAVWIKPLRQ
jgi:ribosomal protein S18 acetylase RimI-like enzyme